MAISRLVAISSLWAQLLFGQQTSSSDVKFVDNVATGFWWRDATADGKLDFLRGFEAGLSVSNSARRDIQVTYLMRAIDRFYLDEANRPLTIAKAFMEVTKPGAPPIYDIPVPVIPSIVTPPQGATQTQTWPSGAYRVGGGVSTPVILYKIEPEYSEEARQAKLNGSVVLYVEIDPTGHVANPRVVRGLGLGLDEKAIEAILKWKFSPGYKDGKPVTVGALIGIQFRLLSPPKKQSDNSK